MKSAFSLIESLVYLLCVILIVNLFVSLFVSFQSKTWAYNSNLQIYISQIKSSIFLFNDLEAIQAQNIKHVSANSIIWSDNESDHAWEFREQKLFRVSGQFNKSTQRWIKRKTDLAATDFDYFMFEPLYNTNKIINGFKIKFKNIGNPKIFKSFVALRSELL